MNIIAIIPARGGSKGLKNKNILKVSGLPLIFHSINLAKKIPDIDDFFISTDSKKIKLIVEKKNIHVPFLRPKNLAKDNSTDLDVIKHFYYWYKKKYLKKIDLLIHLRPTTPFRKVSTILNAIKIMKKNKNFDSLRSFVESDFPGFKLWLRDNDSAQLLVKSNKNYHSMGRQFIPKTFCHVGYIDILRPEKTILKNSMIGKKTFFFELNKDKEYYLDIDTKKDLVFTRNYKS
jgi:CMP-N,N'-diacetyllegionaminic acid synthase